MEYAWIVAAALVVVFLVVMSARVVRQWERGVVLRFGRLSSVKEPGFRVIVPIVDKMMRVDMRIVTMVLEPQEVITRDNVTIRVNAVVYFKVQNPAVAVIQVENYRRATTQIALTSLRSVLGQSDLDEVLAHRDEINSRLREIIDTQTESPWGVQVTVAEVKDVLLPENMQRAMARQAEAERERRAKVVHALGEEQAAATLARAAEVIAGQPIALQLRYLQAMVEMASERSSTIIPLPMDIFSWFKNALGAGQHKDS